MANAQVSEFDVTVVATPPTNAQVSELDVAVLAAPPTNAQVSEIDVAVLAKPPTNGQISELDVAVLSYISPCATSRCQVWKITRKDGEVFAFTSHDQDVEWLGVTYKTCNSLSASASESASDLGSTGSIELTGILDDSAISEGDLYGGKFDDAYVEIWVVPWDGQPDDQAPFRIAAGWIGRVTRGEHNFVAEVLGPGSRLRQTAIVHTCTPGCTWDFGDPATCAVDVDALALTPITVTGSVLRSVVEFTEASPGGTTIWNGGKVVWLTGRNAGATCQVETVDFGAGALGLWDLAPYPPLAGDTFTLLPGCPKTWAGCNAYSNYLNFGGFKDVPGPDALQSNADALL